MNATANFYHFRPWIDMMLSREILCKKPDKEFSREYRIIQHILVGVPMQNLRETQKL